MENRSTDTVSSPAPVPTRTLTNGTASPGVETGGIGARFKAGLQSVLNGAAGRVSFTNSALKRPLQEPSDKNALSAAVLPPELKSSPTVSYEEGNLSNAAPTAVDAALLGDDEGLSATDAGDAVLDDQEEDDLLDSGQTSHPLAHSCQICS